MKILVVLGTRPEAVKLAPVIRLLRDEPDRFLARICVTGQHREMIAPLLDFFGIVPDHDLRIMAENQTPAHVGGATLLALEPIVADERPDAILVQGDTTSVAAASVAGFYSGIRVGHVEAGLRTGDRRRPFPEEINRRIVGITADWHFAPTTRARDNLLREGVAAGAIHVTGNTVIDALQWTIGRPELERIPLPYLLPNRRLVLVTAHRRESFGPPLARICEALRGLAREFRDDAQIVYPVHLNPNVQGPVREALGNEPNIHLVPPLDYLAFVRLMRESVLVMTDSGGIQEEAPSLGKPVLVLREVTERPEAVEAGAAELVGTDPARILAAARRLLTDPKAYARMARAINPFGDGHAAERIVAALRSDA
jgi:UDP-N-acetylglucosamine 2-epimerase (non-hydrolysing)